MQQSDVRRIRNAIVQDMQAIEADETILEEWIRQAQEGIGMETALAYLEEQIGQDQHALQTQKKQREDHRQMQDHLRKQLEEAERHQALQEEKQRLEEQLAVWKEELEAIEKQLADNKLQNERDQLLLKNRLWKVPNPIMKNWRIWNGKLRQSRYHKSRRKHAYRNTDRLFSRRRSTMSKCKSRSGKARMQRCYY